MKQNDIDALRIDRQNTTPRQRTWLLLLLLGLFAVVAVWAILIGWNRLSAKTPSTQDVLPFQVEPIDPDLLLTAGGYVQGVQVVDLRFPVSGQIEEIFVSPSEPVTRGQILARLSVDAFQAEVDRAEAALAIALAELARLQAPARPQDLVAAEETVATAQANAKAAQALLTAAQAELSRTETGTSAAQAQVVIAQARLKVSQAQLEQAAAGASPEELAIARAALGKAQSAVRRAQADLDRVGGASDTPQALALEQATLDLEAAQARYDQVAASPRPTDLAALQAGVEVAQAEVAAARVRVVQAESQVTQAQAGVAAAQAQVEAARGQLAQAQAQWDRLQAGATEEEIAIARAQVTQARAAVRIAQAQSTQAVLVAPMVGTVLACNYSTGELVSPAGGLPVVTLADLSRWLVEVDVAETDIGLVALGQAVQITLDSAPDILYSGQVADIAPQADRQTATIRVWVAIDSPDEQLRPGLSARVTFTGREGEQ